MAVDLNRSKFVLFPRHSASAGTIVSGSRRLCRVLTGNAAKGAVTGQPAASLKPDAFFFAAEPDKVLTERPSGEPPALGRDLPPVFLCQCP